MRYGDSVGIPPNHDAVLLKSICLEVHNCVTHAVEVSRKLTAAGWRGRTHTEGGTRRVSSSVHKNTGHPVTFEFQINYNIWDTLILKKKKYLSEVKVCVSCSVESDCLRPHGL